MLFEKLPISFGREPLFLNIYTYNNIKNIFFFMKCNNDIVGGFIQLSIGDLNIIIL